MRVNISLLFGVFVGSALNMVSAQNTGEEFFVKIDNEAFYASVLESLLRTGFDRDQNPRKVSAVYLPLKDKYDSQAVLEAKRLAAQLSEKVYTGKISMEELVSKYADNGSFSGRWISAFEFPSTLEDQIFSTGAGFVSSPVILDNAVAFVKVDSISRKVPKFFNKNDQDLIQRYNNAPDAKDRFDNLMYENSSRLKYLKQNTIALNKVLKSAGKMIFDPSRTLTAVGNEPIYTVGAQNYTQQDLVNDINQVSKTLQNATNSRLLLDEVLEKAKAKVYLNDYNASKQEYLKQGEGTYTQSYIDQTINQYKKHLREQSISDQQAKLAYIEENKDKLWWKERAEVDVYLCSDDKISTEIAQKLANYATVNDILTQYNGKTDANGQPLVKSYSQKIETKSDFFPYGMTIKPGVKIFKDAQGNSTVVLIKKITPPQAMTTEESLAAISEDYIEKYVASEIQKLSSTQKVEVNQEVKDLLLEKFKK
ncbi:MAG: hypothetical protein C4K58_03025 [Flavobacteriaceae bacterium]|nr:MAG: hypothetical protein C4K58_03025 [Flavobacteriaceae bacterium]